MSDLSGCANNHRLAWPTPCGGIRAAVVSFPSCGGAAPAAEAPQRDVSVPPCGERIKDGAKIR